MYKLFLISLLNFQSYLHGQDSAFSRVLCPVHPSSPSSPSRLHEAREVTLMGAVGSNNLSALKSIINSGVNLNCIDIDKTPLGFAASKGYIDAMRILVAAGARVDFGLQDRATLRVPIIKSDLMLAVESGSFEAVDYILECGANPEFEYSSDSETALYFAVEAGRFDFVKSIVANYKDKLCLNKHVSKALVLALNRGRNDIAKYLTDSSTGYKLEPAILVFAIKSNKIDTVKFILGLHVLDLNIPDMSGFAYLDHALTSTRMDIIKLLITSGADIYGKRGEWALKLAVQNGDINFVSDLIMYGVDVNVRYADSSTPLSLARGYGFKEIEDLLVDNGAGARNYACAIL